VERPVNGISLAFASIGVLVTATSVIVSVLLYIKGAYSKQKEAELRSDRDDAISRAEGWAAEAKQKDQALIRCANEAKQLRRELEVYRKAPQLAIQEIGQLIDVSTKSILEAVKNGSGPRV